MDKSGNSSFRKTPTPLSQRARKSLDDLISHQQNQTADSLISHGQLCLLHGHLKQGLDAFDSAIKIDPSNPQIYYAQGLSLFAYGSEEGKSKALLLASRKFKLATTLNPRYFDAWLAWGSTLCTLGLSSGEHHYFQQAKDKFSQALSFSESEDRDTLSELYWDFATVQSRLADHSGEALDWNTTIECFQKATGYQDQLPPDFWQDFGKACLKLASQINDTRLYAKGISCFKQAVFLDSGSSEGWSLLAAGLQELYVLTHDEDHFSQASECYHSATQLQPDNSTLWLKWARFLLASTRRNLDEKKLRACIEKCHRASAIDADDPLIQATWAEALAHLGQLTERVELIYDAHNKIADAVEKDENQPEIWYCYGMCLNASGRYFNDLDYYYQAIEKFQTGLSIDRTCDQHWQAIGNAYALLGHLELDSQNLERSLRFFQRTLDLNPSSFAIFDYAVALCKLGDLTHEQKWYDEAIFQFERALNMQRNAIYLHPNWLFHYACTLDALGDFHEEEYYYLRSIEIFSHVLMIDPDFHEVHHRLALALSHLGELTCEIDPFFRAVHHYRLGLKNDEENDTIILDWAISLINLAQYTYDSIEADQFYRDAEHKLTTAAKLGNLHAFYHLSCLHSLLQNYDKAMGFLLKADAHRSLPPLEELLNDEWLDGLRATGDFREFIYQLEHRPNLQEER